MNMVIVYIEDGWYVVTLPDWKQVAGPYQLHEDAVRAAETRAFRIAQGWSP